MAHDFKSFPELTNSQMDFYYFESPHKQIFEDFNARVISVHDGDTIKVRWSQRDFDFPIRFSNVSVRELVEKESRDTSFQLSIDGKTAQAWLENKLLGEDITVLIDKNNRVEKFGRLLGRIVFNGIDIGEEEINQGIAVPWANRNDGKWINPIPEVKWS